MTPDELQSLITARIAANRSASERNRQKRDYAAANTYSDRAQALDELREAIEAAGGFEMAASFAGGPIVRLYKPDEAAGLAKVQTSTIYGAIKRGKLKTTRTDGGRGVLIPADELDRWMGARHDTRDSGEVEFKIPDGYVSVREAAKILKMDVGGVGYRIEKGMLKAKRGHWGMTRIILDRAEVEAARKSIRSK